MAQRHRLYRSRDDRVFLGVSGGMADYFDIDPAIVRVAWVATTILTGGIAGLIYLALAVSMPNRDRAARNESSENDHDSDAAAHDHEATRQTAKNLLGIALIVAGTLFLIDSLNILGSIRWDIVWPVALIALGVAILIPAIASRR